MTSEAQRRTLLTLEESAEYLGCTDRHLRNQIKAGRLKAYRLGRRAIRIDLKDLDQLLTPIPPGDAQ